MKERPRHPSFNLLLEGSEPGRYSLDDLMRLTLQSAERQRMNREWKINDSKRAPARRFGHYRVNHPVL